VQSTGRSSLLAGQETNLESRMCAESFRAAGPCGRLRAKAESAFRDSQADRVQKVRRNGSALSDAPYAPGARLTCHQMDGVFRKNRRAPQRLRVSKREAKTCTSVCGGGVFGTVQGRVGMTGSFLLAGGRVPGVDGACVGAGC